MNKLKLTLLIVALALMGGTGVALSFLKSHQRLGNPGIKATPIPNSPRVDIYLPEHAAEYDSVFIPTAVDLQGALPLDTSFMVRLYTPTNSVPTNHPFDQLFLSVVMMGIDRTSIHKPQFCLVSQGWNLDSAESSLDKVRIESPHPYDLEVMKLVGTREVKSQGKIYKMRGMYVYWFVADNDLTARHEIRMLRSTTHLLRTGELERWAYISCLAYCWPGQEDATYDRIKTLISAAVPQFQLAVNPPVTPEIGARQTAAR